MPVQAPGKGTRSRSGAVDVVCGLVQELSDRGRNVFAVRDPHGFVVITLERRRAPVPLISVLTVLWRNGELLGDKPEQAFFVKCDRTTMTQNDIGNGRLVVGIGVAPVKPAVVLVAQEPAVAL
jgi:hypothetical protein